MKLYEALVNELGMDWREEFPILAGAVDRIEAPDSEEPEASSGQEHRQYETPILSCQAGLGSSGLVDAVAALIEREVRI